MLPGWYRDIERRVFGMISRGIVTKLEEQDVQNCALSVMDGEDFDDVERVQNYGFAGFPGTNAQAVVVYVTGSREFPVIISADHPDLRFKVKEWECAMWTKFGTHIYLKDDESVDVKADKLEVVLDSEALITSPKTVFESNQFAVKNAGGDELVKLLSEILDQLITINAAITPAGIPAPAKVPITLALSLLKTRLTTFMVT